MNTRLYFLLFIIIINIKIITVTILFISGYQYLEGDAEYYNEFALGQTSVVTSLWPVILRELNNIGLYSRNGVIVTLLIMGNILIPLQVANLTIIRQCPSQAFFWLSALAISLYATVFYYSLDINRDVFMFFVFLIGLSFVRSYLNTEFKIKKIILFILILFAAYLLYLLRPYLGFGYFFAFLFCSLYSFKRFSLVVVLLIGLGVLFVAFWMNLLESIIKYREVFDLMDGSTNLGIRFDSVLYFIPDFISSAYLQLFGIYFSSLRLILPFILESIPFTIFLYFLIKYKRYSDKFIDFLMLFFFIYSTIWILGNDNLGTAIRLRIFSYIAIFISFMIVIQRKRMASRTDRFCNKVVLE